MLPLFRDSVSYVSVWVYAAIFLRRHIAYAITLLSSLRVKIIPICLYARIDDKRNIAPVATLMPTMVIIALLPLHCRLLPLRLIAAIRHYFPDAFDLRFDFTAASLFAVMNNG